MKRDGRNREERTKIPGKRAGWKMGEARRGLRLTAHLTPENEKKTKESHIEKSLEIVKQSFFNKFDSRTQFNGEIRSEPLTEATIKVKIRKIVKWKSIDRMRSERRRSNEIFSPRIFFFSDFRTDPVDTRPFRFAVGHRLPMPCKVHVLSTTTEGDLNLNGRAGYERRWGETTWRLAASFRSRRGGEGVRRGNTKEVERRRGGW